MYYYDVEITINGTIHELTVKAKNIEDAIATGIRLLRRCGVEGPVAYSNAKAL